MIVNEQHGVDGLIRFIIDKYLVNLLCVCIFQSATDDDRIVFGSGDEAGAATNASGYSPSSMWSTVPIIHFNTATSLNRTIMVTALNRGCQAFVTSHSAAYDFLEAYQSAIDLVEYRYTMAYFVAYPGTMVANLVAATNVTAIIFNHPTMSNMPKNLIIKPIVSGNRGGDDGGGSTPLYYRCADISFELLTTKFVGRYNNSEPILLSVYNAANRSFAFVGDATTTATMTVANVYNAIDGDATIVDLFPNKLIDLQGRYLRLAIFNYPPYTIWRTVQENETGNANSIGTPDQHDNILLEGTEALMFIEFCRKFNCKLQLSLDDTSEWGEIFDNRTGNGLIGALVERRVEISVGALYTWFDIFPYFAFSKPITRSGITCLVPFPQLRPGWLTPALPFSPSLWSAMFGSSIVAAFMLKLVDMAVKSCWHTALMQEAPSKRLTIAECFNLIYRIFILQSARITTKYVAILFMIGCLLLAGLMLGNAYAGGLSSVMTIPQFEASIDTVDQLVDAHLEWGATHDAWVFSIRSATQPKIVQLVSMFRTFSKAELERRVAKRNFGFTIERLPYGHFAVGDYISANSVDSLEIMLQDIYYEYCIAMSHKNWPFQTQFDDLVLRVAQSGVQRYWEQKVVLKHTDNKVQLGVTYSRNQKHDNGRPVTLKLAHLQGVYIVWLIGLCFATIAFIVELLVGRNMRNMR